MNAKSKLQPLSNAQKAALSILARRAWELSKCRRAIEDDTSFDDYRRSGQLQAIGKASLTDMTQSDYLYVRGHWHTIVGNAELAFDDFMNAGADQEERRQLWYRLAGIVARLAEGIATQKGGEISQEQAAQESWDYTVAVAKDKYRGRPLSALTAKELTTLGFTINNRARDMMGEGDRDDRNKKQRSGFYRRNPVQQPETDRSGPSLVEAARTRLSQRHTETLA